MVPTKNGRRRDRLFLSVVGARPQFVKAWVVASAFDSAAARSGARHAIVHTGQHFEKQMSDVFFRQLGMPRPIRTLGLGGLSPAVQLGRMIEKLEKVYAELDPACVIAYGDTTTTLGAGLAAALAKIPVAHVEAGLRSHNRAMPEELNRVQVDHLSEWRFCSSAVGRRNLAEEGIRAGVHVVGDVMVDALFAMSRAARLATGRVLKAYGLQTKDFYLLTIHRTENTVAADAVIRLLKRLDRRERPTLFPVHPRTRNLLKAAGFDAGTLKRVRAVEPLGYIEMLALERAACAVLTDSGGVQKEAHFWRVPCLTLREETEWVETLAGGANRLTGLDAARVERALNRVNVQRKRSAMRPYGDGGSARRLVKVLLAQAGRDG